MRHVTAAGLLMVLCGSLVAQSPRDLTGKWVVGQVMGVGAQYRISEVADRNSGVVLKMNKALLGTLIEDK